MRLRLGRIRSRDVNPLNFLACGLQPSGSSMARARSVRACQNWRGYGHRTPSRVSHGLTNLVFARAERPRAGAGCDVGVAGSPWLEWRAARRSSRSRRARCSTALPRSACSLSTGRRLRFCLATGSSNGISPRVQPATSFGLAAYARLCEVVRDRLRASAPRRIPRICMR